MVEYLEKDYVYVNSLNRSSGTSAAFYIDLGSQIRQPNNYDSITLLSASIPKSYYLIDSTNNTFTITETGGNGTKTIAITVGNYSFSQMATTLTTLIAAAGLAFTYTISTSTATGKFTFTQTTGASASSMTFTTASPNAVLGFSVGSTAFSGTVAPFTLTSTNVVNFQLTNNIQLMCDVVEKGMLAVVIPDESDFSTILYQEPNPAFASKQLTNTNTHSFYFYLLNGQNGKPINLNGLDLQFTFVIYKRNNYYNLMLADHQLKLLQDHYNDLAKGPSSATGNN